jgi:hypothetical protein
MPPKLERDREHDGEAFESDANGSQTDSRAVSTSERRYARRYGLKVPLVFCPMHSPLTDGLQVKSINISSRGVYFVTSHPVGVGLPVRVLLRMPSRIAGTLPTERVFTGRVSHVEGKESPSESSGVGVEFFYW